MQETKAKKGPIKWIESYVPKAYIRVFGFAIVVAIGAIFTNWESRNVAKECRESNKANEGRIVKQDAQIRNLEASYEKLRANMLLVSMAEDNYPAPKWLKSPDGVMLRLNKAYETEFLLPFGITRSDYIGRTDFEIWPDEIARKFREKDQFVIKTGEPVTTIEVVEYPDGTRENFEVTKYPWIINGTVLGVAGYVDVDFKDGYKIRSNERRKATK